MFSVSFSCQGPVGPMGARGDPGSEGAMVSKHLLGPLHHCIAVVNLLCDPTEC